jgi:hypothetical protein
LGECVSEASLYGNESNNNRASIALDSLGSELETLQTHRETTNNNYRLSNTLDFEERPAAKADNGRTDGLSGSIPGWLKDLVDAEEGEVWRRRRSGGAFRAFQQKGQVVETAVANNKMVRLILYNPSHFVENHKGESVTLVQRKIKILNYPGSPWDWESSGLVRAKITTKEMLYSNR